MSAARWGAVAVLVITAIGVGTLVASAYEHATPMPHPGEAAPVPTFDLGVATPTPTPTPTPAAPPQISRDSERFLAVAPGAWWRGTAGACGGAAPRVERSADDGATWTDVTPLYIGAAQLAALNAVDQSEAELIVGVAPDCAPQALRTYTQGEFWESLPEILAASRYVSLTDPAALQLRGSASPAPCGDARSLRAQGDLAALVCDRVAHVSASDGAWAPLPATDAVAVTIDGDWVLVAHTAQQCDGLALTRYTSGSPDAARCAEGLDATLPTAIASIPNGTLVWSGDTIAVIP